MRCLATVLALAFLAGCASYTPAQLVTEGKKTTYESKQLPLHAAGCMAKNIENASTALEPNVRQMQDGTVEVMVRAPAVQTAPNMALIQLAPTASGSLATVHFPPERSDDAIRKFSDFTFKGC